MTESQGDPPERLRFADVLTTGSAVANYLGEANVTAHHLLSSIAILKGELVLEDLGRAVSPLVRRTPPGMGGAVDAPVRLLAQRWFALLGADTNATISEAQLADLVAELEQLRENTGE